MPRKDTPRVAVLGAGPIGLEAALYARRLGLPAIVYERGRIAEHWQRWGHVRLFSPFSMNTTHLGRAAIKAEHARHDFPGDNDCITAKQHFDLYLQPLSQLDEMRDCLRTGVEVLHIGRQGYLKHEAPGDALRGKQPFRLLVRGTDKKETLRGSRCGSGLHRHLQSAPLAGRRRHPRAWRSRRRATHCLRPGGHPGRAP